MTLRSMKKKNDDRTRYQILYPDTTPIENFTAHERIKFLGRCRTLRNRGVKFTTWDTRNNAASTLFPRIF